MLGKKLTFWVPVISSSKQSNILGAAICFHTITVLCNIRITQTLTLLWITNI